MQNGYHHTPNKGTPHCDGDDAKAKEKGGSGHHRRKRAGSSGGSSHGTCTTEDGGPVR